MTTTLGRSLLPVARSLRDPHDERWLYGPPRIHRRFRLCCHALGPPVDSASAGGTAGETRPAQITEQPKGEARCPTTRPCPFIAQMDESFWRIDEGRLPVCDLGTVVAIIRDGAFARVVREGGGQVALLHPATTRQSSTPDASTITLVNETEGWQAVLSRAEAASGDTRSPTRRSYAGHLGSGSTPSPHMPVCGRAPIQ